MYIFVFIIEKNGFNRSLQLIRVERMKLLWRKMGQSMGHMSKTSGDLMEERDRVLHWSAEVLARVDDNINNEDTFLMDYDNERIKVKVHQFIANHRIRSNEGFQMFLNGNIYYRDKIEEGIKEISEEINVKMEKKYEVAYGDIRKFNKRVDALGRNQRSVHNAILKLENSCGDDRKKFVRKFKPLRGKVISNLHTSQNIYVQENKLNDKFEEKVYDIDEELQAECHKKLDKFLRALEK